MRLPMVLCIAKHHCRFKMLLPIQNGDDAREFCKRLIRLTRRGCSTRAEEPGCPNSSRMERRGRSWHLLSLFVVLRIERAPDFVTGPFLDPHRRREPPGSGSLGFWAIF